MDLKAEIAKRLRKVIDENFDGYVDSLYDKMAHRTLKAGDVLHFTVTMVYAFEIDYTEVK
jgi:hypothetical protein